MNALLVCLCVLSRSGAAAAPGPVVVTVEQDGDVILPCRLGSQQNVASGLFHWKKAAQGGEPQKEVFFYEAAAHYNNGLYGQSPDFRGRVSFFEEQLKHGNASILIGNAKMADAGNYSCAFPLLQTPQTFYLQLLVGAAPKPSLTSLDQTEWWSLLQCEAHGNPPPAVRWEDGSGKQLSAGEAQSSQRGSSFYVKVNVSVTQTDRYRCVATQESLHHRVHADTFVRISPGGSQEPVITSLKVSKGAWLRCVVRGAPPDLRLQWEDGSGTPLAAHQAAFPVGGVSDDIVLNVTVTQTDRYRCVATGRTGRRSEAEIYVYIAGSSGWSSSFVVVVVVVAAVVSSVLFVVVVLFVLLYRRYVSLKSKTDSSGTKAEPPEPETGPPKETGPALV